MTSLAEFMILSGGDNPPPMSDKPLYDSWKSIMELYMQNQEHGRMILESVEHGPLIWPTIEENWVIRTKKYAELSASEKIQADCDVKATKIILQGLPLDVYIDSGLAVPVFKQGDDPIDAINKMISFLSMVISSRFLTTNSQLRNSSNPRQQAATHDGKVTIQPLQGRSNSYVAGTSGTRADVLSEVPHSEHTNNDILNQNVQDMPYSKQTHLVNYPKTKVTSDSNIIPYSQYLLETQNAAVQNINSSAQQDVMILYVFEQLLNQISSMFYDGNVLAREPNVISIADSKETLMLDEEIQSKMLLKQMDVPSELPKVCLVNASLKNLKYHLAQFDSVVKQRITPNALIEGMYNLDPVILASRDKNNKETHIYYLKHTMEQASIHKEIVKQAKSLNPLDIASYTALPRKKTTPHSAETPKPEFKVYSRRPKQVKNVGLSKKTKIVESKIANNLEPNHSWGSTDTDIPSSSSLVNDRLSRLFSGLSKLKFEKYHPCLACAMGKSNKQSHKPEYEYEDTNQEKLYLLHMDLCGPMRVASVNGKKYILVIVDDYSWFTWMKFLTSKDEAPDFIIKFLKMIKVRLNATVRNIPTDNGTEFFNQTLRSYYESVGISHETSVARTPQQNGVVKRKNRTLVEAARTLLIYTKAPLFLGADVPVFDEFFSPPASVASSIPAVEASAAVESAGLPSSTFFDQDANEYFSNHLTITIPRNPS
uniref:Retrovirus-related Pol polyprotein from transposon TNT 1-94 n=1 Tax=Tanacetum cinerariifolium TaxID=118510 RepID=A0A6L2LA18_TANCI|nr:retrovirus-related Pol polyprotein from transposon TNT 1-94 [Tanacetum cinerariifolium]